jgi:hypothetical protein
LKTVVLIEDLFWNTAQSRNWLTFQMCLYPPSSGRLWR